MPADHDSLAHFPDRSPVAPRERESAEAARALQERVQKLEQLLEAQVLPVSRAAGEAAARPGRPSRIRLDNVYFRQLFENSPDGIALLTADDRVIDVNRGFEELFGYPAAEAAGHPINSLIVPKEAIDEAWSLTETVLGGDIVTTEKVRCRKDGTEVHVRILGYPIFDEERLIGVFGIYSDASFRVLTERRLRLQGAAMRSAASSIFITDWNGSIEWVNPAFSRLSGYREDDVMGRTAEILQPASWSSECELDTMRMLAPGDMWRGQVVNRHQAGHLYTVDQTVTLLADSGTGEKHFVVVQEDITARLETEQRLKHMAGHDFLTDLPNRYNFSKQLEAEIERSQRSGRMLAMMLLDVDQFKDINDTFGHSLGDDLLVAVSRRLATALRDRSVLARFGGDEFAILQTDIEDIGNASGFARRLIGLFAEPVDVQDRKIHVSVSIGIAVFPPGQPDPKDLTRCADLALYQAKSEGRSTFRFYVDGMDREVRQRMKCGQQLYGALERGEFLMEYQPQVDSQTREIVAVEGLLRWRHPERGMVGPTEFVPVAEASGLIVPIGAWALRQACADAQRWREATGVEIPVAVNLSAVQFKDPRLFESVLEALAESGLPGTSAKATRRSDTSAGSRSAS
jgi:diguanylate cyclase (GGDEF)-like protein/PAS domain S-box-containing protein